jgi:D-amino-acid dehydrogenase
VNEGLEQNLHYPSILVDARVATTPINRWLRIGGTMELGAHENRVLPRRVKSIYEAFKTYYPAMKLPYPEEKDTWYGYRPVTPDGLPYIGAAKKYGNLYIAGGHAMLGVSAASATGLLITQLVSKQKTEISTEAFVPERF